MEYVGIVDYKNLQMICREMVNGFDVLTTSWCMFKRYVIVIESVAEWYDILWICKKNNSYSFISNFGLSREIEKRTIIWSLK